MIGYIIAGFSILSLLLGGTTFYYKDRYEDAVQFQERAEVLVRQQEEYTKLVKHQTKRQLEVTNEQHKLEIDRLTSDINRMRKQTNRSILPPIPPNTKHPNEVTFDREKLDRALQEFRNEIAELIGEGSYCQVDLETIDTWLRKQRLISEN